MKNIKKGFEWRVAYSSTNETDEFGRWQRKSYYNDLCMGEISGFVLGENEKLDNRRIGIVDFFCLNINFPKPNGIYYSQTCRNFDEAVEIFENLFTEFKIQIM
jgi:hypothetical protein